MVILYTEMKVLSQNVAKGVCSAIASYSENRISNPEPEDRLS